jgi:hypothetical protein
MYRLREANNKKPTLRRAGMLTKQVVANKAAQLLHRSL